MSQKGLSHSYFESALSFIHAKRFNALMEVVDGLIESRTLTITQIGRSISNLARPKHNIKKVDRLCSNPRLLSELPDIYQSISEQLFTHFPNEIPVIVDVCFIKDHHELQTIRASLPLKGRSLTIYEYCYHKKDLKRAQHYFREQLKAILPEEREVILIFDAGFKSLWFEQIKKLGWHWVGRVRQGGNSCQLAGETHWYTAKELFEKVPNKLIEFGDALLGVQSQLSCKLIGFNKVIKGRSQKNYRGEKSRRGESQEYSRSYREPWILSTSLQDKTAKEIVALYEKRMMIEESFRDLKSHQFGLGARYSKTRSSNRWNILLVFANLAILLLWVVGANAHRQGKHTHYQSNSRTTRREFSNISLGIIIIKKTRPPDRILLISNAILSYLKGELI